MDGRAMRMDLLQCHREVTRSSRSMSRKRSQSLLPVLALNQLQTQEQVQENRRVRDSKG